MAGIVPWCERYVKPASSVKAPDLDFSLTPWLCEPLENGNDGVTRSNTLMKPIQSGGTQMGECVLLHKMAHAFRGDCVYYWPTFTQATENWTKRFERTVK